jgi:hypothetical protein
VCSKTRREEHSCFLIAALIACGRLPDYESANLATDLVARRPPAIARVPRSPA